MKKFKCIASGRVERRVGKGMFAKTISEYTSKSFVFFAKNFLHAILLAEKTAKKEMLFEALKVSEIKKQ